MHFFMPMVPPTCTAQEHKVRIVNGRPVFYKPQELKRAEELLMGHLMASTPDKPMEGPISLRVLWLFPKGKNHRHGEWRVTRPDTDNLQKLIKDCMTRCGYWKDDAQVVSETAEKRWSDEPCGIFIEVRELEADDGG